MDRHDELLKTPAELLKRVFDAMPEAARPPRIMGLCVIPRDPGVPDYIEYPIIVMYAHPELMGQDRKMPTEYVTLMLEASMAAYAEVVTTPNTTDANSGEFTARTWYDPDRFWVAPTRLEALLDACKSKSV